MFILQVKDFNIAKTDKDIGYYAGYIGERITTFEVSETRRSGFRAGLK